MEETQDFMFVFTIEKQTYVFPQGTPLSQSISLITTL